MSVRAVCTICSDVFDGEASMSAIPCGHVFHTGCLTEWFNIAPVKTCPQCRTRVGTNRLICKLFFNVCDESGTEDGSNPLQDECDQLKRNLQAKEQECKSGQDMIGHLLDNIEKQKVALDELHRKVSDKSTVIYALSKQAKHQEMECQATNEELTRLKSHIKTLESVDVLLKGQKEEVEVMIKDVGISKSAVEQLSTFCVSLKREYDNLKEALKSSKSMCDQLKKEVLASNIKEKKATLDMTLTQGRIAALEKDLAKADKEIICLKEKVEFYEKTQSTPEKSDSFKECSFENSLPQRRSSRFKGPVFASSNTCVLTPDEKVGSKPKKIKVDSTVRKAEWPPTDEKKDFAWANSNLFRKKTTGSKLNSTTQTARPTYDGLGGRTKAILPSASRTLSGNKVKRKAVCKGPCKTVSLQTLDWFLDEKPGGSGTQKPVFSVTLSSDTD